MQPIIRAEHLGKIYRSGKIEVPALQDASFTVDPGEFVSIVGASGCGKTTFLRMVDGLIEPTSGSILIDGQAVTGPSSNRAFVFQRDSLFPWRSVLQNTVFGPDGALIVV